MDRGYMHNMYFGFSGYPMSCLRGCLTGCLTGCYRSIQFILPSCYLGCLLGDPEGTPALDVFLALGEFIIDILRYFY